MAVFSGKKKNILFLLFGFTEAGIQVKKRKKYFELRALIKIFLSLWQSCRKPLKSLVEKYDGRCYFSGLFCIWEWNFNVRVCWSCYAVQMKNTHPCVSLLLKWCRIKEERSEFKSPGKLSPAGVPHPEVKCWRYSTLCNRLALVDR